MTRLARRSTIHQHVRLVLFAFTNDRPERTKLFTVETVLGNLFGQGLDFVTLHVLDRFANHFEGLVFLRSRRLLLDSKLSRCFQQGINLLLFFIGRLLWAHITALGTLVLHVFGIVFTLPTSPRAGAVAYDPK
jgi:hypothetical protein